VGESSIPSPLASLAGIFGVYLSWPSSATIKTMKSIVPCPHCPHFGCLVKGIIVGGVDFRSLMEPAIFQAQFGAGIDQLEALVASNTVNISRLVEIAPVGTVDPTSSLYNSTIILMAVLLAIALVSNALMSLVGAKHHI
jgi:hypothetical protein